ncbi:Putative uncharacterized protein [Lactobacillus equicursoris 66c]|uniref:Uncharacterized protein n=1 Tax=Lactobacillus equicursoris 66c TaxID=872326 RepID=K0NXD0_9LACO|nr:hypothetical protein [Lactobacillus equicursoris]CCK84095.1 Putative uncharacterized protein [Lactobacillus equicursoris 66c]
MALSIDNLGREDLVTLLDGYINHTQQINEAENKYSDRYDEIRDSRLLAEYKKPKNMIKNFLLAPFYANKLRWLAIFFDFWGALGVLFAFVFIYEIISDLFTGNLANLANNFVDNLTEVLAGLLLGSIGYFMGRKNYKEHWFKKKIESGDLDTDIDVEADTDSLSNAYKNEYSSLVNDERYQQYLSLIPKNFTLDDIVGIHQVLSDYRADNFKEAVNVWRQEQHNQRVENKLNEQDGKYEQLRNDLYDIRQQQDEDRSRTNFMADKLATAAMNARRTAESAAKSAQNAKRTAESAASRAQDASSTSTHTQNDFESWKKNYR